MKQIFGYQRQASTHTLAQSKKCLLVKNLTCLQKLPLNSKVVTIELVDLIQIILPKKREVQKKKGKFLNRNSRMTIGKFHMRL